jgi:hypothetical protein
MRVLLKQKGLELYVKWVSWEKGKPWTIKIDWTTERDQATRFWSKDSDFLKVIETKFKTNSPVYVLQYGPNHDQTN